MTVAVASVVWTREAFLKAAEGGAFEDRRVELIEGSLSRPWERIIRTEFL